MWNKLQKLLLMLFFVIGISFADPVTVDAFYPNTLNGDPNYILASAHMDIGFYVRKDSLTKDFVKPPHYQYSVEVVSALANSEDVHSGTDKDWRMKEEKRFTMTFYYEGGTMGMYFVKKDGSLKYLDPKGSWAENGFLDGVGKVVWELGSKG